MQAVMSLATVLSQHVPCKTGQVEGGGTVSDFGQCQVAGRNRKFCVTFLEPYIVKYICNGNQ